MRVYVTPALLMKIADPTCHIDIVTEEPAYTRETRKWNQDTVCTTMGVSYLAHASTPHLFVRLQPHSAQQATPNQCPSSSTVN